MVYYSMNKTETRKASREEKKMRINKTNKAQTTEHFYGFEDSIGAGPAVVETFEECQRSVAKANAEYQQKLAQKWSS